jgi:hypothetical protein
VPKYSYFPHFTVWRSDYGPTLFIDIRARPVGDIPQGEPIAESVPTLPTHFADFLTAIGKLGPVHTAGRPLIKRGCRESKNYSLLGRHFLNKDEKSPVPSKKSQKNSLVHVLNLFLVSQIKVEGPAGLHAGTLRLRECPLYP